MFSFVIRNWMAGKIRTRLNLYNNWTLYNEKMARLFGKNCLTREKMQFCRGIQMGGCSSGVGEINRRMKCNTAVKFLFLLVKIQ